MKIILNNVARVQHAEVEIKGISVISGYNGTGKSTVCKALYATSQAFGRLNKSVLQSRENSVKTALMNGKANHAPILCRFGKNAVITSSIYWNR